MLLDDLNWMDVENYLTQDDRVMIITAACEQHAYLSLTTDIQIPLAVARAAIQQEPVLVAPPLSFGVSPYFLAYPGTISLSEGTFTRVVKEIVESLLSQGFRRVLINNGHGGNTVLLNALMDNLRAEHDGTTFALFEAWRLPAVAALAEEAGYSLNHANWSEAFPFTQIAESPAERKPAPVFPRDGTPAEVRAALGDGNFGGAYTAPDTLMQSCFDAMVQGLVEALRSL